MTQPLSRDLPAAHEPLHISDGSLEVVGQPGLNEFQIEDLFIADVRRVSSLPAWEAQRAAEQLMDAIRRSATTDNRLWLLTDGPRLTRAPTTYVRSLGFNGSQGYWPMALAFLLVPGAWWFCLGYIPRRYPRLRTASPGFTN